MHDTLSRGRAQKAAPLRHTSEQDRLSRVPTDALWGLAATHQPEITEEIFRRFHPLARRLASRYRNLNEPYEDLAQVACVGLLGAIRRYDSERGVPFEGFAIPTILGELKRHFRTTGWAVHVTRHMQELAQQVNQAQRSLTELGEPTPTVARLAQYLELEIADVIDGLDAHRAHFAQSLDAPLDDGPEPESLLDTVGGDDERYALRERAIDLSAGVRQLPWPERRALTLRVTEDLTQAQIAQRMHCSQMQVSRLLRRASDRMLR